MGDESLCFISSEIIICNDNENNGISFQVTNAEFDDTTYALGVALGGEIGEKNNLKNLKPVWEHFISINMQSRIKIEHEKKKRCLLVVDITYFPSIKSYVDKRDQNSLIDGSKFADDVSKLYNTYDMTKSVPMIIVNLNNSFTRLKLVSF